MTNVEPGYLNYHHYPNERYDAEIVGSIPGHAELHLEIAGILRKDFFGRSIRVLELGPGTGLTTKVLTENAMVDSYTGIDFSEPMLEGAKRRLDGQKGLSFVQGDYSVMPLPDANDLVLSVIGIHHQGTDAAKKTLFDRIRKATREGGAFIMGDLVTHRDPHKAALCEARHYHHLVENSPGEDALREWAHHHKFLNALAPLEDQVDWLREVGFETVEVRFEKFNTALIYAR